MSSSVLRDSERAKFGAELVRLKNEMQAQASDLGATVVGRRSILSAMLERAQTESETFGESDVADVEATIAYQDALIKSVIDSMTESDRESLVEILTSAGYTVTAP